MTTISGIGFKPSNRHIIGQLELPTQGGTGGILIGGDVLLYRGAANLLYFATGDSIRLRSTSSLSFRDSALAVSSKDDGHLDIDADVSIDLNSPVVNIPDEIAHDGDIDTYIQFLPNQIKLHAGNVKQIDINATGVGFCNTAPQAQQAHIVDADGQLADITAKFNTLLADLEGYGLLATS